MENNILLAKFIARNIHKQYDFLQDNFPFDYYDIESIAFEGLCRCVLTFDETLGYKFSTYASKYIYYFTVNKIFYEASTVTIKRLRKSRSYDYMKKFLFEVSNFVSIDEPISRNDTYCTVFYRDIIVDNSNKLESAEDRVLLSTIISLLSMDELKLILFYYNPNISWKEKEAYAKSIGIAANTLSHRVKKIVKKVKKAINV